MKGEITTWSFYTHHFFFLFAFLWFYEMCRLVFWCLKNMSQTVYMDKELFCTTYMRLATCCFYDSVWPSTRTPPRDSVNWLNPDCTLSKFSRRESWEHRLLWVQLRFDFIRHLFSYGQSSTCLIPLQFIKILIPRLSWFFCFWFLLWFAYLQRRLNFRCIKKEYLDSMWHP